MWKKFLVRAGIVDGALLGLVVLLALAGWIFVASLQLDREPVADPATRAEDLPFLSGRVDESRGRILAVVASTERFPDDSRKAGYELTELSRAYWVFRANGYEVDIASPRGGSAPMVLDDDLTEADYAFLNDADARARIADTLPLATVDPEQYQAVYFVGGKGAMFDFAGDAEVGRIIRAIYPRGVVGAVCHGPAALLGIVLDDGRPLLQGRRVAGFTNAEELFLIKDARERFPFLLQDALTTEGAHFVEAPAYLDNTVVDGHLVTGQNPWSTWSTAEAMIRALGHTPVPREPTREEQSIRLLATYHDKGLAAAVDEKRSAPASDKRLLLLHALIAAMQWRLGQAWELQRLARA